MALINCPECGREISNRVKACPHCGYPFEATEQEASKPETPPTKPSFMPKKRAAIIIGASVLGLALLIGGGIFIKKSVDQGTAYKEAQALFTEGKYGNAQEAFLALGEYKDSTARAEESRIYAKNDYIDKLHLIRYSMLNGASEAESVCNLTAKVWNNAIHEERDAETDKYTMTDNLWFVSDFNDALYNLFKDPDFMDQTSNIEKNQAEVANTLKELQNPIDEFKECYATVNTLYGSYKSLTDLAVNPTGSYTTFTQNKNAKVSSFLEVFSLLETQIPERESTTPPVINDLDYFRNTKWGMTKDEVKNSETFDEQDEDDPNKLSYIVNDNLGFENADTYVTYTFDENDQTLVSASVLFLGSDANQTKTMMLLNKYRERYGEYEDPGYLGGKWVTNHSIIEISYVMDGVISVSYSDIAKSDSDQNKEV